MKILSISHKQLLEMEALVQGVVKYAQNKTNVMHTILDLEIICRLCVEQILKGTSGRKHY